MNPDLPPSNPVMEAGIQHAHKTQELILASWRHGLCDGLEIAAKITDMVAGDVNNTGEVRSTANLLGQHIRLTALGLPEAEKEATGADGS